MEFDLASKRLQREQQRSKQTTMKKKVMSMSASHHHTKEMQLQQKQQRQQLEEKRQKERQQKLYETQLLNAYMHKYDSKLHIQSLFSKLLPPLLPSSTPVTPSASKQAQQHQQQQQHINLIPISIHGNGDKITLPPSMLERLLQIQEQSAMTNGSDNNSNTQQQQQQPWTFRIAIRNPKSLIHPISDELQNYVQENFRKDMDDSIDDEEDDDDLDDDDDDDDAMEIDGSNNHTTRNRHWKKKQFLNDMTYYMNELQQHQYISYTHGTVIEFTQEEGYIGIPKAIAHSLLSQSSSSTKINIETSRTVDPATAVKRVSEDMNSDETDTVIDTNVAEEEKTPGHVAYNAFDVPALPIEIVLLQLPKGTGMTLRPIMNSNNSSTKSFYQLQQDQVKYALEQSIQRTRATITLHDTITTWYRGNEYQFLVTKLAASSSLSSSNENGTPNLYNAVSCINTDIEIEFEPMHVEDAVDNNRSTVVTATNATNGTIRTTGTGRRLVDEPKATVTTPLNHSTSNKQSNLLSTGATGDTILLPPEPPMEEKTNIITIQFRFNSQNSTTTGSPIQRRFDITTTTIGDLFDFIRWQQQLQQSNDPTASSGTRTSPPPPPQQQLVRRFPRRAFTNSDTNMTLQEVGFQLGNELLIVEEL